MNTKILIAISVGLLGLVFVTFSQPPSPVKPSVETLNNQSKIITNVDIFDGEKWLIQHDIAFKNGFIEAVGIDLDLEITPANIISGTGLYLIPGLIDAHTHAWDNALEQAVAFGVTTELDMFTNNAFAITQRKQRAHHDKNIQQADLFSAGTLVTAPEGHGTEYGFPIPTISNASQATDFVSARIAEGSDYIKIVFDVDSDCKRMPSIYVATLSAVIEAAHQQDKLAVVHIANLKSAQAAVTAGADGLVHGFFDHDQGIIELSKNMQQRFIIPTLSILASMAGVDTTTELINDFEENEIDISAVKGNLIGLRSANANIKIFEQAINNIGLLAKSGVTILAGTDAPNPGTAHGISLHGELALLVKAGLTPDQALMAATSNVAKTFNLSQRGFIKVGMKADLVLLNKDPRINIRHTRAINTVYKNGFAITASNESASNKVLNQATLLGDFEHDLASSLTTSWQISTDQMFQGNSKANISQHDGVITIIGSVGDKFSYPWAGIYLPFAPDQKTAFDISKLTTLEFRAMASAGKYKLMLFAASRPMRPIEVSFSVGKDWQSIEVALTDINPELLTAITGIAIVAGREHTKFTISLDDIWLR